MQAIINYLSQIENLITVLTGVILAGIAAYLQIKAAIAQAKGELTAIALPVIGKAETNPLGVLNSLVNKPVEFDSTFNPTAPFPINSNEGKNLIVSAATFEKAKSEKPGILKKLGIKSVNDMIPLVHNIYQLAAKPLIKALKK